MDEKPMTKRLVTALADPHLDILGHMTGRMVTGKRRRPPSAFDAEIVFAAALRFDKAIEINSRPERLDPPKRILRLAVEAGCRFAIDSDGHAPGQLAWIPFGCDRAAACGVAESSVVNAMDADALLAWAGGHEEAR
jgi:putative hydrolase